MDIIKPDTYSNLIGTLLICVSIVCLFTSFFEIHKKHATKVFSILIVVSLALFSSYWVTYFVAIFIVATAVTELEFLQTLAAIIRKDKNYFDFKKEALSKEDNIRRKAEEALEEELISSESESRLPTKDNIDLSTLLTLPRNEVMRLSLDIEEKALNYLEKENGNIERNVRFRKNGSSVELDGVIDNKGKSANNIFEIKWARNPDHFLPFILHSIRRSSDLIEKYSAITGKKADFQLVVILNTKSSASPEKIERMKERAKEAGITLSFLSLSEIGFEVSHEIA